MTWYKIIILSALPSIRMAGEYYKNQDADNTGKDDLIGISLVYAADLLAWVVSPKSDQEPPKAPDALR